MAQVIDVPEVHRQIIQSDMHDIDAVDGGNGVRVTHTFRRFDQDMNRCREVGAAHELCGRHAPVLSLR